MRRIVVIMGLGLVLNAYAQEEILKLYEEIIHFKRESINAAQVRGTPDPFSYYIAPTLKAKEKDRGGGGELFTPVLRAILENRARIGNVWLKKGEVYRGWKVLFIGQSGVKLESPSGEVRYYPMYKSKLKVER